MRIATSACMLTLLLAARAHAVGACERNRHGGFDDAFCASQAYKLADLELNVVYKRTLNSFAPPSRQKMIEAQRRWVAFRDAHLVFVRTELGEGAQGRLAADTPTKNSPAPAPTSCAAW